MLPNSGLPWPPTGATESTSPASPDQTGTHDGTRWIFSDELQNARDLGGVPLSGGGSSAYDAIFRGPPLKLSATGCKEFADLHIRTVIDLRSAAERDAAPDADCVQSSASMVLAPLDPNSFSYQSYITGAAANTAISKTFTALADSKAYPVYIHCSFGRDRSGVMSALILGALGATRSDIVQEYNLSSASVGSYPAMLTNALDIVDSDGGVEAFLLQAGVTSAQLQALRDIGKAK
jgi:hypothetical protein